MVKNIFDLSYLNSDDVGNCFAFSVAETQTTDPKVAQFVDYLILKYVEDGANFPPNAWTKVGASSENTTNACESFPAHFNKCFYQTHPNLHVFVEILKQFQTVIYKNDKHRPIKCQQFRSSCSKTEKIRRYDKKVFNRYSH